LVKPEDPFEFIELLKTDDMLAKKRNDKLSILAEKIKNYRTLKNKLESIINQNYQSSELIEKIISIDEVFSNDFISLLNEYFNISYSNKNINSYPDIILKNLIELSKKTISSNSDKSYQQELIYKFFQKAEDKNAAEEYLRIGKLSWKLRDDDNILLSRLENALLKLLDKGTDLLIRENIIQSKDFVSSEKWALIYEGLIGKPISLKEKPNTKKTEKYVKHRQLIGQPASNGYVEGKAIVIKDLSDFRKVTKEDILVCDSVQPQMTFLIPLVSGIVERRGGMLVHSSIIAREMGIPAVNGVSRATEYIKTGDFLTINGYLGIVTIGEPEFETEKKFKGS
jgi:pyruvate,water dikinase